MDCETPVTEYQIDNNRSERAIKPFVIERKNWLFAIVTFLLYGNDSSIAMTEAGIRPAAVIL